MTSLITPEELSQRICSGGVLYSITLRKFGTNKKDKDASAKTRLDNHISDRESVATYKKLFKSPILQRLNACDSAIYQIPRKFGSPWGDGTFFIPASKYLAMTREVKAKLAERYLIVKEFADELTLIKNEAITRLGTMYDVNDYPSETDIIGRYTHETHTAQITAPNGTMLGALGDVANAVMNDVQDSFNDQISSMVPFIRATLLDPLIKLSSKLQNPEAKLFDTHFTNVWEASERAAGLNIIGDDEVAAAVYAVDSTLRIQPETCRGSKNRQTRAMCAEDAGKIIELLGGQIPAPAPDSYAKDLPDPPAVIHLDTLQPCDPATLQPESLEVETPIVEPTDEQIHAVADAASELTDEQVGMDVLAKLGW
jgi:hypothetical protein